MTTNRQLLVALCEGIIDNMDASELVQYVFDDLELTYQKYNEEELKNEIEEQLGEEHLTEVLNTIKEEV